MSATGQAVELGPEWGGLQSTHRTGAEPARGFRRAGGGDTGFAKWEPGTGQPGTLLRPAGGGGAGEGSFWEGVGKCWSQQRHWGSRLGRQGKPHLPQVCHPMPCPAPSPRRAQDTLSASNTDGSLPSLSLSPPPQGSRCRSSPGCDVSFPAPSAWPHLSGIAALGLPGNYLQVPCAGWQAGRQAGAAVAIRAL